MAEEYLTISQITQHISRTLAKDLELKKVYLKGEVSNFKQYSSGHCYFTLKDEENQLSAVMFYSSARHLKFKVENGMSVLVHGKIEFYKKQGKTQIKVFKILEDGTGSLHIQFEQLKKKLKSEGLFDKSHKKEIPKYPQKIGIITASNGAAIKDIISTIKRRWPFCEILVFPTLVQGEEAPPKIVKQIRKSQEYNIDVLIIGRGGGSIEDLWAFNEELVAREIFHCKIPVISAVGHEVDYTISDFVADIRAATPTEAGERVVPDYKNVKDELDHLNIRINKVISNKINYYTERLLNIKSRGLFKNPEKIYQNKELDLDFLKSRLNNTGNIIIHNKENNLNSLKNSYIIKNPYILIDKKEEKCENLTQEIKYKSKNLIKDKEIQLNKIKESYTIKNPYILIDKKEEKCENLTQEIKYKSKNLIKDKEIQLNKIKESYTIKNPNHIINLKSQKFLEYFNKLEILNPLSTLKRGYTLVKVDGHYISKSKNLKKGDKIEVEFSDGTINTEVLNKDNKSD